MSSFKSYEDYQDWVDAVARTTERTRDEVESEAGHIWPLTTETDSKEI